MIIHPSWVWVAIAALVAGYAMADQPIRRISESGYDYGECAGLILTVMLSPEPCDEAIGDR